MKIDIQKYNENKMDNVTISFPNEGSVTEIHITIIPHPERSFYRNSKITFSYNVSEKYPIEPPEVKCLNKILPPNIDKSGNVCLNLLRGGWKPIYELEFRSDIRRLEENSTIILKLQNLFRQQSFQILLSLRQLILHLIIF